MNAHEPPFSCEDNLMQRREELHAALFCGLATSGRSTGQMTFEQCRGQLEGLKMSSCKCCNRSVMGLSWQAAGAISWQRQAERKQALQHHGSMLGQRQVGGHMRQRGNSEWEVMHCSHRRSCVWRVTFQRFPVHKVQGCTQIVRGPFALDLCLQLQEPQSTSQIARGCDLIFHSFAENTTDRRCCRARHWTMASKCMSNDNGSLGSVGICRCPGLGSTRTCVK